jgi:glucuronate isomerase
MRQFLDDDFLLQTDRARELYHEWAESLPVIDYHSHLSPEDIAGNRQFKNLTEAWLEGDHYKWRAMRTHGIPEEYCTGDKGHFEKFKKWAETVPYTLRNPLFHWTHLELKRYFDISKLLNPDSAEEIYNITGEMLASDDFRCRNLLRKMNVEVVCTTDDPIDSLEFHQQMIKEDFEIRVLPTFRPDRAMAVENVKKFNDYLHALKEVTNLEIKNFQQYIEALEKRHHFFHEMGCRLSDHGIETFYAENYSIDDINQIFEKISMGSDLNLNEILQFKSAMMIEFALLNNSRKWTQQFHYGALRNNNSLMLKKIGKDSGFDSIGDLPVAQNMSKFLDRLANQGKLTKTILYNLNPGDNELVAAMAGNFQDGSSPGKMQFGSGWWYLDQKDGMERQMNCLSNIGLLRHFVGMTTDSRSFLSYPRHEYFRRVLCNMVGTDVENGELPADMDLVGKMVQDICYNNARDYFGFTE